MAQATEGHPAAVATGHGLHDHHVPFEEYLYWAQISRADERYEDPRHDYTLFGKVIKKGRTAGAATLPPEPTSVAEKNGGGSDFEKSAVVPADTRGRLPITDAEYTNASRALRTATWGAIFYLITTDILGPFSVPWAFAAVCLVFLRYFRGLALL